MTAFHMPELMDAVRLPDHNQVASRIKDLVINQLVATDERVKIHKTEYFNHSFVPDLVLSWQDQEGRHLFLRPETRPELLVDDLRISGDLHPIYFSLTDIDTDSAREHRAELEIMSAQSDTLVTDSDGLDRLISSRRENPIAQLASSAALQGARGVLDAPRAVLVARAVTDGLNAASNVDQTGAAAASQTISSMFDSRRSSQLNRLLLAVWTGSGGSASQFPVPINSISGLDEESIDYLLRLNLIDDEEFWRRIGRQLRLGHLSSLRIEDDSPNFQMLVNANIDVLAARTCRVEPVVPTLMDPDPESADHPLQ
jgi:hypothetical protein